MMPNIDRSACHNRLLAPLRQCGVGMEFGLCELTTLINPFLEQDILYDLIRTRQLCVLWAIYLLILKRINSPLVHVKSIGMQKRAERGEKEATTDGKTEDSSANGRNLSVFV